MDYKGVCGLGMVLLHPQNVCFYVCDCILKFLQIQFGNLGIQLNNCNFKLLPVSYSFAANLLRKEDEIYSIMLLNLLEFLLLELEMP